MKKNKKDILIKKAKEIIAHKNYSSMKIEELTKSCNLSKSTFYHYFKTKQELYDLIVENIIKDDLNKLKEIKFTGNLEKDLKLIINHMMNKTFIDIKIIEKDILNGFNSFNETNTKIFNEVIKILKERVQLDESNYFFVILVLKVLCHEFVIVSENKVSKRKEIENINEKKSLFSEIEDLEFIKENIFILIFNYIKIKKGI